MLKRLVYTALISAAFFACKERKTENANITQDDFLWQFMDSTVKPGDDFFKYATGNWMAKMKFLLPNDVGESLIL